MTPTPAQLPVRVVILLRQSEVCEEDFRRTRRLSSLEEAVRLIDTALAELTEDHPGYPPVLSLLVALLLARFEHTGTPQHLDEVVRRGREAVRRTLPADRRTRGAAQAILGVALWNRFKLTGERATLAECIDQCRQATTLISDNAKAWSGLSSALNTWAEHTGEAEHFPEAVSAARRAVELAPRDPGKLSNLGNKLHTWYQHSGDRAALAESVEHCRRALDLSPDDDIHRDTRLVNLAASMRDHAETLTDFDEAIRLFRQGLAATSDGHVWQAMRWAGLGQTFAYRFDRSGDAVDLRQATSAMRRAVAAAPDGHTDRPYLLSNLAGLLIQVAENTSETIDPDEVIGLCEAALAATRTDDPMLPKRRSELGDAWRLRYQRTGEPAALEQAVDLCAQAVDHAARNSSDLDVCLFNLASALRAQFDRTGGHTALNQAIEAFREAAELIADDKTLKSIALAQLGAALRARYDRTGQPPDLDEAIDAARRSIGLIHGGHPSRGIVLNNLANALQAKYELADDREALREAMQAGRQAMECAPPGHPSRGMYLTNLGNSLRAWATSTDNGDPDGTLADAVEMGRRSVALLPPDHPFQYGAHYNLAVTLHAEFDRSEDPAVLRESMQTFQTVAHDPLAPTLLRVNAAARWGRLAAQIKDWPEAHHGFSHAVELLPAVATRRLDRVDREYGLGHIPGLASRAAAAALEIGQPERAVALLEQGRGVLITQALETRADISELRGRAPELAERFEQLRDQLDNTGFGEPTTARGAPMDPTTARNRRRELVAAWEDLLTRIRSLDGLHDFGRPPPIDRLLAQAAEGPIVLVNVSEFRSDALILTRHGVRAVPLPDLTPRHVVDLYSRLRRSLADIGDFGTKAMLSILADLWDTVTGPVLDELGFTDRHRDGEPWPRVWWSATGLLSLLPLHAAGRHDGTGRPSPQTVLDRVVSSYIPTIQALEHARTHRTTEPVPAAGLLVTGLPRTPDAGDLPGVIRETALLQQRFSQAHVLLGGDATRDHVFAELPTHPVAHFACHAESMPDSLSRSHLLLHNSRVTTLDVASQRLTGSQLAFLSACSTTETDPTLADEAIHITAAFQLAGYPHVVGTLWPILDAIAPKVVDLFYDRLTAPSSMLNVNRCSVALHAAVREIYRHYPRAPAVWASHIHSGL